MVRFCRRPLPLLPVALGVIRRFAVRVVVLRGGRVRWRVRASRRGVVRGYGYVLSDVALARMGIYNRTGCMVRFCRGPLPLLPVALGAFRRSAVRVAVVRVRLSRRGVVRGYGESYSGWIVSAVSPNSGGKTHNGGLPALVALAKARAIASHAKTRKSVPPHNRARQSHCGVSSCPARQAAHARGARV